METDALQFELDHSSGRITVRKHVVAGQVVYHVLFTDKRRPLVLHRALDANASRFWTSIPEGRQQEAEEVGYLILEYFKTKP
jgi:hypothetical protein